MAFNLEDCYGFGKGHNFTDYEIPAGQVSRDLNSYALITDINANLITIDIEKAYIGQFGSFKAGEVILIHASASPTLQTEKLGKFICAKIEVAEDGFLTLDKNISTIFADDDLENYCIQAITFAEFHCLKICSGAAVQPQIFSSANHYGGILAVKVSDTLTLHGDIDLTDCGISTYQKDYLRPLTTQEINGTLNADPQAGEENYCINNIFPLNSGDGAAFIFAKELFTYRNARIGNPETHGKINCRGAADSPFKPSNITNIGGSSILICTETTKIFPINLAKYRRLSDSDAKKGKGLARCYVATQDYCKGDDALFHADVISDHARLSRTHKVIDFGTGKHGDSQNPTFRLNERIVFHRISDNSAEIVVNNKKGLATLKTGTKCIMINFISTFNEIVEVNGDVVTFKNKLTDEIFPCITIAEFENLTLTQDFEEDYFAVMVKNKCKIAGKIKATSFIFANELELSSGAWLGERVLLAANKITGDLASAVPKGAFTFVNEIL